MRTIMEQLLLVLDFFEKKRIVHRDLKPDNILINSIKDKGKSYEIKVADLGLAVGLPSNDTPLYLKCGSPGYIAPEVFQSNPFIKQGYGCKADIFSAGSIFFNLLTGFYIFHGTYHMIQCYHLVGRTQQELLSSNKACNLERIMPYLERFSSSCRDLLLRMLKKDPFERPSAAEAL